MRSSTSSFLRDKFHAWTHRGYYTRTPQTNQFEVDSFVEFQAKMVVIMKNTTDAMVISEMRLEAYRELFCCFLVGL